MSREGHATFAIGYGALEGALANLVGADEDAVRSRFRKLRLRPFPDIQTGTGQRVRYDLPRALAIAAVFELNSLLLPQGQAVTLVQGAWPEVCRASIAAAVELGLASRPAAMPEGAGSDLTLMPDAFARGAAAEVVSARTDAAGSSIFAGPVIRLGMRRIVGALAMASGGAANSLTGSAAELEGSFGWAVPRLKSGEVSRVVRGVSFLAEGPWLERAEALLTAPEVAFDPGRSPHSVARLQALCDYLLAPAPVDAWKGEVGERKGAPRLKHLIAAFARANGLEVAMPETLTAAAGADPRAQALDFVRRAQRGGGGKKVVG